jgi:hypothetical protein
MSALLYYIEEILNVAIKFHKKFIRKYTFICNIYFVKVYSM